MNKFNIGDSITPIKSTGMMICEVLSIHNNMYELRVLCHTATEIVGYEYFRDNETVDRLFVLEAPHNPNLITTSSLDYMTNKAFTDEDKRIIETYLEKVACINSQ